MRNVYSCPYDETNILFYWTSGVFFGIKFERYSYFPLASLIMDYYGEIIDVLEWNLGAHTLFHIITQMFNTKTSAHPKIWIVAISYLTRGSEAAIRRSEFFLTKQGS